MGLGLWTLLKCCLLFANAGAILHEDRFLKKFELHTTEQTAYGIQSPWKKQVAGVLAAVRLLRVPLIGFNAVGIVLELLF